MRKKVIKENQYNPFVRMTVLGILCVVGISVLTFYVCAKMMGDSLYYTLYKRYDKSAAYEDTQRDLILHSRTHKPFTGVIVLEDDLAQAGKDIFPDEFKFSKKEVFIKNGQIRGEKVYDTHTGKLCRETFFDYDGHFKYRRSYGTDCSYLEKEEIFQKDANVVLFYNAKGQKTVKAYIEDNRFTHGFCYEGFGQTLPLTKHQLERLNLWDTTVTCRD